MGLHLPASPVSRRALLRFAFLVLISWFLLPQDLKDFMRQAGEITYADAHKMRVGEG